MRPPLDPTPSAPLVTRLVILSLSIAVYWYWMMALHELGHVFHAWLSGGTVIRVVLEPLAISRTDVAPNPSPMFVAWGGLVWGCVLPLVVWGVAAFAVKRVRTWTQGLAGFCLIANGLYLGSGAVMPVGDTQDLLRMGVPGWLMGVLGLPVAAAGLYVLHRLGPGLGTRHAQWRDVVYAGVTLVITLGAMLLM